MTSIRPIHRVLVANRGEIAVRVIKACHELGIEAVAVYSDADSNALHVQLADRAVHIGPPQAGASYLNQARLIEAARETDADAVHPGYGFLSENADFAAACEEAGLIFIGPTSGSIRAMADKSAAKRAVELLGVPLVPGYHGEQQGDDALASEAERVGFPLLIKASAGGGGRGMRVVRGEDEVRSGIESARREAIAGFGDGRLLLERYLERPRHIEVQVLADNYGNTIHLGERECSIQRRHQKIVEEATAPGLPEATRAAMGEAAVRVARSINYRSAGTIEFLVDEDGQFYFLEMNTRVQVEHGVTELVTGIDIVQAQLRIAMGQSLTLKQDDISFRGHAIQCRVYAEDPYRQFLPSTGPLLSFEPPIGGGIRVDAGVFAGDAISPYYDALLAKLQTFGANRDEAIERMDWALRNFVILGVNTNLPIHFDIINHPAFRSGNTDVHLLERDILPAVSAPQELPIAVPVAAALVGPMTAEGAAQAGTPWQALKGWRGAGARSEQRFEWNGQEISVSSGRISNGWSVRFTGTELLVNARLPRPGALLLEFDGSVSTLRFAQQGHVLHLNYEGRSYVLAKPKRVSLSDGAKSGGPAGRQSLKAPLPGVIMKVNVREGDEVTAHQTLVVLEAMKMEHTLQAATAGVVRRVNCRVDDRVNEGELLIEIEAPP